MKWNMLAMFIGLIAMPDIGLGQGFFRDSGESRTAELLPVPRVVRQQVRDAQEALDQKRYSDAAVRLGDLLRRSSQDNQPEMAQDYFSPSAALEGLSDASRPMIEQEINNGGQAFGSSGDPATVMRQVRDMIGRLPKPAMEVYELRYGPLATKLLQEASPSRDWNAIEQVRREFFHTEAGYQASYLLAMREWLLGNPLTVSMLLDDVVTLPRAIDVLGEKIVWMHAGACVLSGRDVPQPVRIPADFVSEQPEQPQGNEASQSIDITAWDAAVRSRYSTTTFTVDPPADDYLYLGGRPNRSGTSAGQMPLSNPRWVVESSGSPRQERLLEAETAQFKSSGQLPPPSWIPLRVGDQLLMRTTQRLYGIDHSSGKRVWQYPWFDPPEEITTPDDDDSGELPDQEDPIDILAQRVWNDVPFGQVASDGERVFMLDDLAQVEVERINPFGMRGIRSVKASKNTLVALDLATEGKLLWRIGSVETTPSRFSDAFFLGPPLPFRGRLYVMVEMGGEIVLECLDPRDGSEIWRQVLVSIESSGITSDPVRRVAGAMPTYHEGLLICPTGTGVTIAVDLIDRTLRWANHHPRNQEFAQNAFQQPADPSRTELSQRWATSVAIGHGTNVALTPVESDRMIVADVVTGRDRFRPQPRGKDLYLAGLRDQLFFLVRADRMIAYDLQTGNEVWTTPAEMMRSGQRVSGRGVFGSSSYYLPTSTDELIEIGLESGQIISRRNVRYPLGNLIAVDGEIISQATTTVAVAYGEDTLRPNVDRILAEDPEDVFALIRKAELLMEEDQRPEALALLEKARSLEPDSDDVIALSVEAMLGSLRDQQEISAEDLQILRALIEAPEQTAELLVLQIRRQLQPLEDHDSETTVSQADLLAAFDQLLELSALMIERPNIANQQSAIFPDQTRQFTLSAWVTARVADVVATAEESTFKEISDRFGSHLQTRIRPSRMMLSQIVEHFAPLGEMIEPSQHSLLEQWSESFDALAIERMVWGTRLPTDAATAELDTPSLLALAKMYSVAQWNHDRRAVGDILQQRIQAPDADPEDVQRIAGVLSEFQVLGVGRVVQQAWPRDFVNLQWQSTNLPQTQVLTSDRRYARTTRLMGQQLLGWQAISDSGSNPLSLLDHDGLARPVVVEGLTARNSSDKEITMSGGLMMILTPSELIAVDLFRVLAQGTDEVVRWRHSLHPDGQAVAKRRSETSKFGDQIYRYVSNAPTANADDAQLRLGPVLGDRVFLLQGEDLICYHVTTGEQLWRTKTNIAGSGVVVGDGRVGVLSERSDKVAYFNWYDGRELDARSLEIDSVVATLGRHALMVKKYDDREGKTDLFDPYLLEIVDGITGDRVCGRVASPVNLTDQPRSAAYGELVNGRYFALLDDQGGTTIWDVLSGESLADVTIPVRENLFGLSVVQTENRFLMLPRCRLPQTTLNTTTTVTVASGLSVQGATSVHCIELPTTDGRDTIEEKDTPASARVAWSLAFDEARGVTTYQPWLTPMLMFVRGHSHFESTASRRRELDVWALDIENGKTLNELIGKNIGSRNNRIETQLRLLPHRNQVIAFIQNELLTYTFSDQPAEVGEDASVDTDGAANGDP